MDLLKEAKSSNKEAFLALVDKYSTVFYKVSRIYFYLDTDIYNSLETSLSTIFQGIVNIKTERDFLCYSIKELVAACNSIQEKLKPSKNISDDEDEDDKNAHLKNTKYRMYKLDSIVEKCITELNDDNKLVALLYFYVDLTISEISFITNYSKNEITSKINTSREKIYSTIDREEPKTNE